MSRVAILQVTVSLWLAMTAAGVGGDVVTLGENSAGPAAGLPGGAEPGSISLWFARQPGAADQVLFVYGEQQKGRARGLWLVKEDQLCFYFMGWPDDLHVKVPGGVEAGVCRVVEGEEFT